MSEQAQREMTLAEIVGNLPASHQARHEYATLMDAANTRPSHDPLLARVQEIAKHGGLAFLARDAWLKANPDAVADDWNRRCPQDERDVWLTATEVVYAALRDAASKVSK